MKKNSEALMNELYDVFDGLRNDTISIKDANKKKIWRSWKLDNYANQKNVKPVVLN